MGFGVRLRVDFGRGCGLKSRPGVALWLRGCTRVGMADGSGDHTSGVLGVFDETGEENVTERRVKQ